MTEYPPSHTGTHGNISQLAQSELTSFCAMPSTTYQHVLDGAENVETDCYHASVICISVQTANYTK